MAIWHHKPWWILCTQRCLNHHLNPFFQTAWRVMGRIAIEKVAGAVLKIAMNASVATASCDPRCRHHACILFSKNLEYWIYCIFLKQLSALNKVAQQIRILMVHLPWNAQKLVLEIYIFSSVHGICNLQSFILIESTAATAVVDVTLKLLPPF